jgi:hypothetical protein
MQTGGCYCGAIRFEAGGEPFHATICHCEDCRRIAGAPAVAWFSVPTEHYRVVAGRPAVFASSEDGERSFCAACGTGLTFRSRTTPDEIDVATCTLDEPGNVPPADHTRYGSRLAWWDELGALPKHAGARPADR